MSSFVRIGAKAVGATVVGGSSYGAYLYSTDEGTKRSFQAYSTFAPVILHYRWTELKDRYIASVSDDDWEALDERYAAQTVRKLGELQGMYSKYGQTAAGLTNTLGDAWIRELRTLENDIPPRPLEVVRTTIEEETPGKKLEDTFSEFDPKPMGSASIGQVHRARLRSTGREVAVKVQYPEAKILFEDDIHAIRSLCERFAPEQVCTLEALEEQNKSELDYTNEAKNLQEIGANMAKHGFQPKECLVPQPLPELTTKRMLVMELLPGPKLIDGMRAYYAEYARKQGTTLKRLETKMRKKMEEEGIPDRYDGPSASQIASYQKMMRIADGFFNVFVVGGYNACVAPIRRGIRWLRKKRGDDDDDGTMKIRRTSIPPNTPRIVDSLMRIHGYQLLIDGLFNADPHGGNFLLLPDGRIGLIDYGATKRLSENERISACVMFAALHRKDKDMLWTMAKLGGYKSKHMNPDVYYKLAQFGFDSWGREVTGGKNVQQFMDDLKAQDPYTETPDNFVLASFMSVRLRALTLGMNHPIKCSDYWGEIAERELNRMGLPYETWNEEQLLKYPVDVNIQKFEM
mmetsp:Transcript_7430/g.18213  ORF Transcript_7430/g.18213 Transcript_7430/m.18213 type:complete len:573 (+) Transcript_7430:202-1920(+)